MGGFSISRLYEVVAGASWVSIAIWIGLATLTIALLVMMRTSWGQSNPLNKCAGLSLLAHLLLAGYATTVHIVTGGSGFGDAPMRISLSDSGPTGPTPLDGGRAGKASQWDGVSAGGLTLPDVQTTSPAIAMSPIPSSLPATLTSPSSFDPPAAEPSASLPAIPTAIPTAPHALVASPVMRTPSKTAELVEQTPPAVAGTPNVTGGPPAPTAGNLEPIGVLSGVGVAELLPKKSDTLPSEFGPTSPGLPPLETVRPSVLEPRVAAAQGGKVGEGAGGTGGNGAGTGARAPTGPIDVPEIYRDRLAGDKPGLIASRGGSDATETAVKAALRWLASTQSKDGRWRAADFGAGTDTAADGQQRKGAGGRADTGVSSLALLAFLGAGHTHLKGEYATTVQHGLEFLLSKQGTNGNLGGDAENFSFMYCHGISTLALSEAYALTRDSRLEKPLRNAIAYTLSAQHPSTGGWRYQPHEPGDTSQLGWQLMALKSAELSGLEIPARTREGINKFLRSVSSGREGGLASYRPGERSSRTMTAEALVCRQFLGMAPDHPAVAEATTFILADLPAVERTNIYYWYYGTLALYHTQGDDWHKWNDAMQSALIKQQETRGDLAGSWTPDGVWGGYGGRVYSTAMAALCLEVYYRYLPLYGATKGEPPTRR